MLFTENTQVVSPQVTAVLLLKCFVGLGGLSLLAGVRYVRVDSFVVKAAETVFALKVASYSATMTA